MSLEDQEESERFLWIRFDQLGLMEDGVVMRLGLMDSNRLAAELSSGHWTLNHLFYFVTMCSIKLLLSPETDAHHLGSVC
jgi:hypothetical protein